MIFDNLTHLDTPHGYVWKKKKDPGNRINYSIDMFYTFLSVRTQTQFCIKIFEVDFVIESQ